MTYSGRMGQQHSNGSFKLVHAHCNKINGVRRRKKKEQCNTQINNNNSDKKGWKMTHYSIQKKKGWRIIYYIDLCENQNVMKKRSPTKARKVIGQQTVWNLHII